MYDLQDIENHLWLGVQVTTIGKPKIDKRPKITYMGIRTIAPFKGMSKEISRIADELNAWVDEHKIKTAGPPFLRYHVIDMRGFMDISYCVPAGKYASLIYLGGGISGNRALIEWVRAQGMDFDRWDTEQGDNFRGRYETYLTDPKIEPRKSKWQIEVAIKLTDK
jgi:effector-binding domain-containing protein